MLPYALVGHTHPSEKDALIAIIEETEVEYWKRRLPYAFSRHFRSKESDSETLKAN